MAIVVHTIKHSALGQPWVECQSFLHQIGNIGPLIYCEVEEVFGRKESDDHPKNLGEEAPSESEACRGYVEVDSAPHTDDQSADADRDDPKRAPLLRFSHP